MSPDITIMPPLDGEDMAPTKRNDESENRINDETRDSALTSLMDT